MYYDEETQRKYIRRVLFFVGAIIVAFLLVILSSGSAKTETPAFSGKDETPQKIIDQKEDHLYSVVSVTDGDTINIDYDGVTTPVRLIGVNTPETVDERTPVECYGPEASEFLKSFLDNKRVRIETDPTQENVDKYGRLLRYVYLDNEDVGLKIITNGYGREYTYNEHYEKQSEYKAAQTEAERNGRGLWSADACNTTSVIDYTVTLNEQSNVANTTDTNTTECRIKGNISSKGEKIYHVPGQQYYEETIISPNKGERWFCTEAEAINAGWRKSKV